ncbi:MAG: hypothetical protein B7X08_01745 [Acidocella sp. 20-63-7]|nr:MAG: hypothetical protein B7X08_01745 [Acidocella sp. 20-63-7]
MQNKMMAHRSPEGRSNVFMVAADVETSAGSFQVTHMLTELRTADDMRGYDDGLVHSHGWARTPRER